MDYKTHFLIWLWEILRMLKNPVSSVFRMSRNPETGSLHFNPSNFSSLLQTKSQLLHMLFAWFWNLKKERSWLHGKNQSSRIFFLKKDFIDYFYWKFKLVALLHLKSNLCYFVHLWSFCCMTASSCHLKRIHKESVCNESLHDKCSFFSPLSGIWLFQIPDNRKVSNCVCVL